MDIVEYTEAFGRTILELEKEPVREEAVMVDMVVHAIRGFTNQVPPEQAAAEYWRHNF